MISARALSYVAGKRKILDDLSFEIPKGTFTVVVGENGAGKTTLLKLLMGMARPTSGSLTVRGEHPYDDPFAARRKIAYLAERMNPPVNWSVAEYLAFNRHFYPDYSTELEGRLLKRFRIKPEMRIGQLSAGQWRRAQVTAALAFQPDVILIDEITAVLDIVGRADFMDVLRELESRSETTILMATNIIDDIDTYATDVLLLHEGRLARRSTKAELLALSSGASLTQTLATMIREAER
ncbi:MAG: ABC transporter ATP-binding protein [Deltaproteobacteria bacterium]|nr:ABC transporter ATP-binding protein [Deltaproteobacteria bacterium]